MTTVRDLVNRGILIQVSAFHDDGLGYRSCDICHESATDDIDDVDAVKSLWRNW